MARDPNSDPQGAPGDDFDENAALEAIVLGTASETGEQFFQALVRNLAEALGTAGAWVTEYFPDRRTLKPAASFIFTAARATPSSISVTIQKSSRRSPSYRCRASRASATLIASA